MNLNELTIPEAVKGLKEKQFSSVEMTKDCLKQIKKTEKSLHAFVTVTEKEALAGAKEADAIIKEGKNINPLTGIPVSVKDLLATKGIKTTACSKILENYTAPYDASSVKRIKERGTVIIGKTNCDEFGHGGSTENSAFGPSFNPWDVTRVPGGSSGGSAVSVAAQQCLYSLGTDTGGSVRQPAAYCGISALKPTYGRVSRYGLLSMTSSNDVVGPMADTVEGLAYVLEGIAGQDEFDSTTPNIDIPKYSKELKKGSIEGMKIGIPKEYFNENLNEDVRAKVMAAVEELEKMGAKVKEVSLPHSSLAIAVYYVIAPSEISSNLARFDGIRYGYSARDEDVKSLFEVYTKSRAHGFGDEAKRRIMMGTYSLSSGYYDAYYKKASKVRTLIRNDFDKVFKDVDILATPTAPSIAFKLGEKTDNPLAMYLQDVFVAPASLAGLPALSIPCGFASPAEDDTINLPIGLQLIGRQFNELDLLNAGHKFQRQTDWHTRKPL